MSAAAKIVEWHQLLQVVYSALAAGIGVAGAFSVAVAGATRFTEERRAGAMARAAAFGVLACLGLAVCAAAIVLGIVVMTTKT
ncbi:MAG: hypothetical protein QOK25_684 [Thermoleophilaceae bacterium]|jgi:hypothetical protein|nr:hypothetical protein [Thermoleophilaceae bacterium]